MCDLSLVAIKQSNISPCFQLVKVHQYVPAKTGEYLASKPLQTAGILKDKTQAWKIVQKKKLAKKQSLEGNCEILKTIFKLTALSSDIPASHKGVYLFYNPSINFWNMGALRWKG